MFLGLLLTCTVGMAQTPREDRVAENFLRNGERYLQAGNYAVALDFLEKAADRPFHRSTTLAIYLSGLSHYQLGNFREANRWFDELGEEHPGSRFLSEARYHQALMLMQSRSESRQLAGLEALVAICTNPADSLLKQDASEQIRNFLITQKDLDFCLEYQPVFPPTLRPLLTEALCHHFIEEGQVARARHIYQTFRQENDPSWFSPYVESRLEHAPPDYEVETESHLAVCLPIHLFDLPADSADELPLQQRIALEFYEGFELALQTYQPLARKKFYIKVLDSEGNNAQLYDRLDELEGFSPDLILGDIYNAQSQVIANWAERHQVAQVVPLSPSEALTHGRNQVFVAHPSAERHGKAMAEYAYLVQGMDKVVVWSDQQAGTELLAQAFITQFEELGGEVRYIPLDTVFSPAIRRKIQAEVQDMRVEPVDGVYIPLLNNEETAGLILSEIQARELKVKVMGSPHWYRRYEHIDREMKEVYGVMFTTGYMYDAQSAEYRNFFLEFLRQYQIPPSQYAVQGYDLGLYVLSALDSYQPARDGDLADFLRDLPTIPGLHQDFDFLGQQVNQFVNVGAFQDDGTIIKLNSRQEMTLDLLVEE